ncbi:MAG: hypothetical protein ACW980_25575 [Promethearchaeota archaeon]|jgi:hypothetical protein
MKLTKQIVQFLFFISIIGAFLNLMGCISFKDKSCKIDGNSTPVIEMKITDSEGNVIK